MLHCHRYLCVSVALPALLTLSLAAQTPPASPANKPKTAEASGAVPEAVENGQKVFLSNCSFCHGSNAKGGESGPDLLRSEIVLDDENGSKIGPVVHNGRVDKGMPKFALTDQQISDIAAFLHQRIKAAAERGTYQILNIVTGDPKKGEAYFNGAGHCSQCHSVTGDLAHIGQNMKPVEIQQHIVMPRQRRGGFMQAPKLDKQAVTVVVTLPDGQSTKGTLEQIDDFTVGLRDDSGEYQSFTRNGNVPKVEITDPLKAHIDMLMTYKDADIHNLTAYLVGVK